MAGASLWLRKRVDSAESSPGCVCGSAFRVEEVRVSPGSCGEQMQMQTPEGVLMLAGPCDGENQCADTGGSQLVAATSVG